MASLAVALAAALVGAERVASEVPPQPTLADLSAAIEAVRQSTNFAPRASFALLERWIPRWPAESDRGRELAGLLLNALRAPDTTPLGRTTLAQHLACVAGVPERSALTTMLRDPSFAEVAQIALGGRWPVAPPTAPEALEAARASGSPAQRLAALSQLVHDHPATALRACESSLDDPDEQVAAAAIQWLARLDGARLVARIDSLAASRQVLALEAVAEHRVVEARNAALARLEAAEPRLRDAAIAALGAIGTADDVPALARLGAVQALAAIPDPAADAALVRALSSNDRTTRVTCVQALAARGAAELTPTLLKLADDPDAAVRQAALKTVARHGNADAYDGLAQHLRDRPSPELEDALKQLAQRLADPIRTLAPLAELLRDADAPTSARAAALRILPAIGGASALELLRRYLEPPDSRLADVAARALAQWREPDAVPLLLRLRAAADPAQRQLAIDALNRLAPRLTLLGDPIAYLDCGLFPTASGVDGVSIAVRRGAPWRWTDAPPATVVFDSQQVEIEISGLSLTGRYDVGLSWWDYDAGGREQSVWFDGEPAVSRTRLPQWQRAEQPAAILRLPVPPARIGPGGRITLRVRREAGPNAVVGEVWVVPSVVVSTAAAPASFRIDIRANTGATCRVLIVTGEDIAAHRWPDTTPRLVAALAADPRLEISVAEDPAVLATPAIEPFQVIVLHFQNARSAPSADALERLRRAVSNGCGLVVAHFASGAFFDRSSNSVLPRYTELAGRSWNPRRRGHDPRGPFTVRIADPAHPVTLGLADFETDDELYTCLDGDASIRVLADAVSQVDGRPYPLVFVRPFGRGRVFHCALGHDLRALEPAGVAALYRRGTVWAAGLPPGEFRADGAGFAFHTGELRGRLCDRGRPIGLAPLSRAGDGRSIAQPQGVLSLYRLLDAEHRYTDGWSRTDAVARALADGTAEVEWPATSTDPFELRARWRWASANTVDLEVSVKPLRPLRAFEVFCASYFVGFADAKAWARPHAGAAWLRAEQHDGIWQAFPRDEHAISLLRDGRWQRPPHPVEWTVRPPYAAPLAMRHDEESGLTAVLAARASDCFAVLMPHGAEPHRSLYLSLFGNDLPAGSTATARARLVVGAGLDGRAAEAIAATLRTPVGAEPR
ncbi:MAG: ThuA domain-containing protein [Kiritimatiellae bacterium]|nr:ThuA domain-containing protein [Kiritimatiellia bacterium]